MSNETGWYHANAMSYVLCKTPGCKCVLVALARCSWHYCNLLWFSFLQDFHHHISLIKIQPREKKEPPMYFYLFAGGEIGTEWDFAIFFSQQKRLLLSFGLKRKQEIVFWELLMLLILLVEKLAMALVLKPREFVRLKATVSLKVLKIFWKNTMWYLKVKLIFVKVDFF